jgi:hypothetical protein
MGWIERLTGHAEGPDAALTLLGSLNANSAPVQVEIEGTRLAFRSSVRLRSGAVVLTYPVALERSIHEGAWVRIDVPGGDAHREIRLQVSSARHGGGGVLATDPDHILLLCRIAGASLQTEQRQEVRVGTERYRDVTLRLAALPEAFRILDVSLHGARIRLHSEEDCKCFPLRAHLKRGVLNLGNRAQAGVQDAIPRFVGPDSVGLELMLVQEGRSRSILEAFIATVRSRADGPTTDAGS